MSFDQPSLDGTMTERFVHAPSVDTWIDVCRAHENDTSLMGAMRECFKRYSHIQEVWTFSTVVNEFQRRLTVMADLNDPKWVHVYRYYYLYCQEVYPYEETQDPKQFPRDELLRVDDHYGSVPNLVSRVARIGISVPHRPE